MLRYIQTPTSVNHKGNIMQTFTKGALAALLLTAAPAFAGPFVALTGTSTTSEYKDVNRGIGFALSGGYQAETSPLFVEAEYFNGGKQKIDDFDDGSTALRGGELKYNGFQGFVGASMKFGGDSRGWLKGGYYSFDGKLSADEARDNGTSVFGVSSKGSSKGLTLGVGFDWMFANSFGLRGDIETPFKVDSTPGLQTGEKGQLTVLRLGVVWRPAAAK